MSLEEIKKNIHSNTSEVLLITEDNVKELKSFIIYENLYKYFFIKPENEKKQYLKKHIKKFYNFYLFYENKSTQSPKFSLINEQYIDINNLKEFDIIYRVNKIIKKIPKKKIKNIYYFTYKSHSYIYCEEENKMFQVIKGKKLCWKLMKKDNEKKINTLEAILDITEKNIYKFNLEKYLHLEYRDFKEFYLINEKWLQSKKDKEKYKNETISFKPELKKYSEKYKYPINFRFMEFNKELIDQLLEDKTIGKDDKYLTKMFFISDTRNNPKKIYFGILEDNTNVIYFYKFEKSKYNVQFLIKYENANILSKEIEDNILVKGIETYLYEMRINIEHKLQFLINDNLEKIGIILNVNVDVKNKFIIPEYSNKLEFINDSYFYVNVIQCLVNIEDLKKIFLNRSELFKKKIVDENEYITFHFYKLIGLIWLNFYCNTYFDELENQSEIFLVEIKEKFDKENILKNMKLLIEFILLSMHKEQIAKNNNKSISYKETTLKKFYTKNKPTFISDIFFFKLKFECCPKKFSTNCILSVSTNNLYIKDNESVDIETILSNAEIVLYCDKCNKNNITKIKFETYPKILIIALGQKVNCNIKFKYSEQIVIDSSKYEMISIITKNDNDPYVVTYCKSSIHRNNWRMYKEDLESNKPGPKEIYTFKDIKSLNNIPSILVYRQIKNQKE